MRRSPARILVALALVALLPWCLCRLGLATCGLGTVERAEKPPVLASCCGGCCGGAVDDDREGSEAPAPREHGDDCPSPCCAPKVASVAELPQVPVDSIGAIPCWLDSWGAGGALGAALPAARAAPALLDTGPPDATRSGRAILAAIGRLLI